MLLAPEQGKEGQAGDQGLRISDQPNKSPSETETALLRREVVLLLRSLFACDGEGVALTK